MTCPVNGDQHRYFIHNSGVRTEYVLHMVVDGDDTTTRSLEEAAQVARYLQYKELYQKIETALLGCACGDVIKKEVRNE